MNEYLERRVLEFGSERPNKLAVVCKDEVVTYSELRDKVIHVVAVLRDMGVEENDKVLLQAVVSSNYVVTYIALHIIGAVVVPMDRKAVLQTVIDINESISINHIIGAQKFIEKIEQGISYETIFSFSIESELHDICDSDVMQEYDILYTTGTTGQSKGVVSTRGSVHAAIMNEIEGTNLTEEDVVLIPIPLNHSIGIGKLRAILYLGATVVLYPGVSMAMELKKIIDKYGCTAMVSVPSALQLVYNQAKDKMGEVLGTLRFIEVGSAPFGVELKKILMQHLPDTHILNRYGSTETPGAIYLDLKEAPSKIGSIGRPLSHTLIRVIDDNGEEMISSKDCVGYLAISGPMLMKGYYNAPDLTNEVLRDGFVVSKDLGYIDEDNYVYLIGRQNNVINTGGKKVSPHEVEEYMMESGLIKECAVFGREDANGILGQVPVALCVLMDDGITEKELSAYLKDKLEKYKIPVEYKFVTSLPRNYMGKIDYEKCKKHFEV